MNNNPSETLLITRIKSVIGFAVKLEIFVDDIKIGEIRNGEEKTFSIEEGKHQIYVKRGVWGGNKTKPLTITPKGGATIKLSCGFLGPVNIFLEEYEVSQDLQKAEVSLEASSIQLGSQHKEKGRQNNKIAVQTVVFLAVTVLIIFTGDSHVTWADLIFSSFWGVAVASLVGAFIK